MILRACILVGLVVLGKPASCQTPPFDIRMGSTFSIDLKHPELLGSDSSDFYCSSSLINSQFTFARFDTTLTMVEHASIIVPKEEEFIGVYYLKNKLVYLYSFVNKTSKTRELYANEFGTPPKVAESAKLRLCSDMMEIFAE